MIMKDTIQSKEVVQDIKTSFLYLEKVNGSQSEAWTVIKVTGYVTGDLKTEFYDFYQSRFSGDGMSSSSVTKTDSVRIGESRRNYGKELLEFKSLQAEFEQLSPKFQAKMSNLNGQPASKSLVETQQKYGYNFSRFRPIMYSKYAEKIYHQAESGETITLSGMPPLKVS